MTIQHFKKLYEIVRDEGFGSAWDYDKQVSAERHPIIVAAHKRGKEEIDRLYLDIARDIRLRRSLGLDTHDCVFAIVTSMGTAVTVAYIQGALNATKKHDASDNALLAKYRYLKSK